MFIGVEKRSEAIFIDRFVPLLCQVVTCEFCWKVLSNYGTHKAITYEYIYICIIGLIYFGFVWGSCFISLENIESIIIIKKLKVLSQFGICLDKVGIDE